MDLNHLLYSFYCFSHYFYCIIQVERYSLKETDMALQKKFSVLVFSSVKCTSTKEKKVYA